jgi:ATP-binding cassette, subfamily F, member 3
LTQLSVAGLGVEFGATTLFRDVTFTVSRGERWGIVGRNGSGKTTLFNILTNRMEPTAGGVVIQPGLRISMLEQHRDFESTSSIWETAAGGRADLILLEQSLGEQGTLIGEMGDRATPEILAKYDRDLEQFQREGGYELAPRVDAVLHGLGFDPESSRIRRVSELSGGEQGRLGLARQLISGAQILLLDEPTNHLDLETTVWLESFIRDSDKTFLIISHDRSFLSSIVDHVLHLEAETGTAYSAGYESFVEQRKQRRLERQHGFDKQQRFIAQREDYIRRNIAGQNSKQAKGKRKLLARMPRLSPPPGSEGVMDLHLESRSRGGEQVVVADRATIAIGGKTLIEGFTGQLRRGDRLGFIGPNGSGKSTFLTTLVGTHEVDNGELRLGESTGVSYYRQDLGQVPLSHSLYDTIAALRPNWERRQVQGHLGRFGFSGDEVGRIAVSFSGGERARLALAMMVLSGANLLILDEPTNHLDVESIEALEDALAEYDGTVILVSHDRALLRSLVTRVWVLHNKRVIDFEGSFEEWEIASKERAHAANVSAAEEESLRRVHERQKTRQPQAHKSNRRSTKIMNALVANAEATVSRLESKIVAVSAALSEPELYLTRDGIQRGTVLGAELERLKVELDEALSRWAEASEAIPGAG